MIERNVLLERVELTPRQLARLRGFRLISAPTWRSVPGRGGGESYYPDETLDRIRVIQKYQADDLSLGEITEIMRDCKVAVAGNREFADGTKAERLSNPDQIATILALYEDIKASFGAESLIHIEFEHIERDGQWIVRVPVVIYR